MLCYNMSLGRKKTDKNVWSNLNSRAILGKQAEEWQYRQDAVIESEGFLAQRSQRFPKPVLRIQNIKEYKG